jgi:hypothetical protein
VLKGSKSNFSVYVETYSVLDPEPLEVTSRKLRHLFFFCKFFNFSNTVPRYTVRAIPVYRTGTLMVVVHAIKIKIHRFTSGMDLDPNVNFALASYSITR